MVQTAAILGLLIGLLTRGRLRNLLEHKLNWLPALFASFACEALVFSGLLVHLTGSAAYYPAFRLAAGAAQYTLIALFLIRNIVPSRPAYVKVSLISLLTGSFGNALAILSNQGRMPIDGTAANRFGPAALQKIESAHHYAIATEQTRFFFLGDWIPVWSVGWYLVSPGDFLIAFGLFLFAFSLTRSPYLKTAKTVEHPDEIVYTDCR